MRQLAILLAVLSVGLLFSQFTGLPAVSSETDEQRFAEKANLALRRTAHQLLIKRGDSTSRIPPVRQLTATTFLIRLNSPFAYGQLPALLQQSLVRHGITRAYDVALLDCRNGELQLGYTLLDYQENKSIPCADRQQEPGCYDLRVSFAAPARPSGLPTGWAGGLAALLLLGCAYAAWTRADRQPLSAPPVPANQIELGRTTFHPANQSVVVAGVTHTLTYREAKLLKLFMGAPNQLLERDFILKSVWEDEGIIVGRSVDVFVSRLRKLLQPDPSLRITTIHGVGYRLDVIASQPGTTF